MLILVIVADGLVRGKIAMEYSLECTPDQSSQMWTHSKDVQRYSLQYSSDAMHSAMLSSAQVSSQLQNLTMQKKRSPDVFNDGLKVDRSSKKALNVDGLKFGWP